MHECVCLCLCVRERGGGGEDRERLLITLHLYPRLCPAPTLEEKASLLLHRE